MEISLTLYCATSRPRRIYSNDRKLCFVFVLSLIYFTSAYQNLTDWSKSREKRYLIWADSGATSLGFSLSIPVNMYDKKKWRSFNMIFNFAYQYDMPHTAQDWLGNYNYWQTSRLSDDPRMFVKPEELDITAMYIYAILENYMTNSGVNGRQCMQRAICENAQVYKTEGLVEKIYKKLMTPEDSSEEYYKDAYIEGTKGVDCLQTYKKCPIGDSLLDNFVQYR